jgi:hypothetical protein
LCNRADNTADDFSAPPLPNEEVTMHIFFLAVFEGLKT